MGASQRAKGKCGELEVIRLLKQDFPQAARELSQYQNTLGRDLKGTKPWCVQIKRLKQAPAVEKYLHEAISALDDEYTIPVLFIRGDRGKWLVVMEADAWREML